MAKKSFNLPPLPQALPAVNALPNPEKIGYLLKLSGKGFLYPGSWKRKFCILKDTNLYYYDREDSKGTDKTCGVINLQYNDICKEATGKDSKKAPNVFIIGVSDKSLFDSGKHLFSADTLTDMNDWILNIQKCLARSRARAENDESGFAEPVKPKAVKINDELIKQQIAMEVPETAQLYSINKFRPRGPKGRRLPKRKYFFPRSRITYLDETDSKYMRPRSLRANSLSVLETSIKGDDCSLSENSDMPNSMDIEPGSDESGRSSRQEFVYRYTSSEESLVHEALKENVVEQNVQNLRSGGNVNSRRCPQAPPKKQIQEICPMTNTELPWCREAAPTEDPCLVSEDVCQDDKKMNSMIRYINCRMSDLMNNLATVKGDMSNAQAEVGSLQCNVNNLQQGTGCATDRLDKMTSQIVNLECQLVALLKDVESAVNKVEAIIDETEKAKSQHVILKEECESMLTEIQRTEDLYLSKKLNRTDDELDDLEDSD